MKVRDRTTVNPEKYIYNTPEWKKLKKYRLHLNNSPPFLSSSDLKLNTDVKQTGEQIWSFQDEPGLHAKRSRQLNRSKASSPIWRSCDDVLSFSVFFWEVPCDHFLSPSSPSDYGPRWRFGRCALWSALLRTSVLWRMCSADQLNVDDYLRDIISCIFSYRFRSCGWRRFHNTNL